MAGWRAAQMLLSLPTLIAPTPRPRLAHSAVRPPCAHPSSQSVSRSLPCIARAGRREPLHWVSLWSTGCAFLISSHQEDDPDSVLKRGVDQLTDSSFLLIKRTFTSSELRSLRGLHEIRRRNNLRDIRSLLPRNPRSEGRQPSMISTQTNAITEEVAVGECGAAARLRNQDRTGAGLHLCCSSLLLCVVRGHSEQQYNLYVWCLNTQTLLYSGIPGGVSSQGRPGEVQY